MILLIRAALGASAGGLIGMAIACFSGHYYYQMVPYVGWGLALGSIVAWFAGNQIVGAALGAAMGSYSGFYAIGYLAVAVDGWRNPHYDTGYDYVAVLLALLGGFLGAALGGSLGLRWARHLPLANYPTKR